MTESEALELLRGFGAADLRALVAAAQQMLAAMPVVDIPRACSVCGRSRPAGRKTCSARCADRAVSASAKAYWAGPVGAARRRVLSGLGTPVDAEVIRAAEAQRLLAAR